MYLTYDEYQDFGGTLDETTFTNFEYEAEVYVNFYTFDRLVNDEVIPERVKRLIYKMVELLRQRAESLTLGLAANSVHEANITSQSNDGVSVSYNGMNAATLFTYCKTEINLACEQYLHGLRNEAGRFLLYRGYYPGE